MKKITKREYNLTGKTVYREKSDCSTWIITYYDDFHGWYEAQKIDDQETAVFTPADLIGDYITDDDSMIYSVDYYMVGEFDEPGFGSEKNLTPILCDFDPEKYSVAAIKLMTEEDMCDFIGQEYMIDCDGKSYSNRDKFVKVVLLDYDEDLYTENLD